MKKLYRNITLGLLAAIWVAALLAYPQLPEQVASHWNTAGEVDGYMSRFWGGFLLPVLVTGIYLLLLVIPKIDPRKANIQKFLKEYELFVATITGFLAYIYALSLYWNLVGEFSLTTFIIPALALIFWAMGHLIGKAHPNWFIGIRTPWTLSSDKVWQKTHHTGARLLKYTAPLILVGIWMPALAFWLVIVVAVAFSLGLTIYSYLLFRKIG